MLTLNNRKSCGVNSTSIIQSKCNITIKVTCRNMKHKHWCIYLQFSEARHIYCAVPPFLHFYESTLKYSAVKKHKTWIHRTCLCVALASFCELQWHRWRSNWLQAGRFTVWTQEGARFSTLIKTGSGAHPASCSIGVWSSPGMKVIRGHPIPHVVSCQPFSTMAQIQSQARRFWTYSRVSDTLRGFLLAHQVSLSVSFHHCSILIHSSTTNTV